MEGLTGSLLETTNDAFRVAASPELGGFDSKAKVNRCLEVGEVGSNGARKGRLGNPVKSIIEVFKPSIML